MKFENMETAFVNGVYITPKVVNVLDWMQTGGTLNWECNKREFNNEGINGIIREIEEGNKAILKDMLCDNMEKEKAISLLQLLDGFKYWVGMLAAPEIKKE